MRKYYRKLYDSNNNVTDVIYTEIDDSFIEQESTLLNPINEYVSGD